LRPSLRDLVFVALVCTAPVAAFAQAGLGPDNPVPGGLTLVPGTVVVPGVGGSAVTGRVPLAGTVGAPGVRDFNPGLSAAPQVRETRPEALYPPAYYPPVPPPITLQSTLPQDVQRAPNDVGNTLPPGIANCPAGTVPICDGR
jgi:hypothetical protein